MTECDTNCVSHSCCIYRAIGTRKGDIWDSGRIESDASQWIAYQGKTLKRNAPYYWKVKIDTNKGTTDWSTPAFWTTGLFNEADWQGQWIGLDKAAPGDSETQWSRLAARYLRKEFALKKEVKRATVHIAGMGLYELFINGQTYRQSRFWLLLLPTIGKRFCTTPMMSHRCFKQRMLLE